ncbi:glycosyltransferase family 2 protein [Bradyrhizobium sp. 40]|uniref:glycosyltransferase family 2 protein n=1 Tax=Bradyrhizobium sp. 40 TaxID=2782674 RepID=UPI001FFF58D4|nr:glycosyltransferase family 2 protein [Bradyrhizobium sp. 40]UPJ41142.1 glycosyltransferase family 2 protein [Bradyrhizobium sp. 40]
MPHVSVVIATYRRPKLLARALASALRQTMGDLEVVVAIERDDDKSVNVLHDCPDSRVRYVLNPEKRGPGVARDTAIAACEGKWVAFLDDDDEWLDQKLERQVAVASASSDVIVTTLSRVVTPFGSFIRPAIPYAGDKPIDEWLFGRSSWFKSGESMLQTSSLMLPRAIFERLRFGESRHEEWELAIRAIKQHGFRLVTVQEPLVIYYAGGHYPWQRSAEWVEAVGDLLSPRAISGFCLTVATQGVETSDRNRAFLQFLRLAFRHGRPTAKQLFAFTVIWLLRDSLRHRIRALISGQRSNWSVPDRTS